MVHPEDSMNQVRDEGNCGEVTNRGEEACECVRKDRPEIAVGRILTKAARLRTETSYTQSQELLAYGKDHRQWRWLYERNVERAGPVKSKISVERTGSTSSNRLMRTRTSGGVGAAVSNDRGYPIYPSVLDDVGAAGGLSRRHIFVTSRVFSFRKSVKTFCGVSVSPRKRTLNADAKSPSIGVLLIGFFVRSFTDNRARQQSVPS